jgi:antitoxin component of RelBE/YafQ-DinJ toxin-antitoxin module
MTLQQSKIVLADATKKRLKSLTIELRRLLEEDLGKQLKRLGIDPGKSAPVPVANLSYLTEEEQAIRYALDAVVTKEQAMAGRYSIAVETLRREAAYTHLNRLVGLKCLELRGHLRIEGELTEVVTCRPEYGSRSKWLWTLREREKKYRYGEDAEELLWRDGLIQACAAITTEIRVLFDPEDPYAQVWPSHKALCETVDKLNELPEEAFRADELLGWIYQYFQSEEKARVFEEARTKKKKITWQDIVPVTQLYTERYMVDFLLQNSIGTRWMEMYPDSDAKADWPYYVTPATPHTRSPQPLKEWRILDPCVGSGHFLIVTFDLLAQLYAEERKLAETGRIPQDWTVPANEVAVTILEHNLHGIDIDPRAVQIAALALYLKAKEHGFPSGGRPPVLNLVVADAVLTRGQAYEELLSQYKQDIVAREAIEAIWHALENLRELGSLVRVEEEVEEAVRKAKTKEDKHSPLLSSAKDWEQYKNTLLTRLKEAFVAETKSSNLNERIFGLEGVKGVGLLELLGRRYDVVCTNPPYMGSANMGKVLKDFVRRYYPSGNRDLYAAFILRCQELAKDDSSVVMVTQRSFLNNKYFEDLRANLLEKSTMGLVVDLGTHAFSEVSGEKVSVALHSCHRRNVESPKTVFLDLRFATDPVQKADCLFSHAYLRWDHPWRLFKDLPAKRMMYPASTGMLRLFVGTTSWDDGVRDTSLAYARRGLDTCEVDRWTRFWWEVNERKGWVQYIRGPHGHRWDGGFIQVVFWGTNGKEIKTGGRAIVPNEDLYFQPCATFSRIGTRGIIARRNTTALISDSGSGVFSSMLSPELISALLNSRIVANLLRLINPSYNFQTGDINSLPRPECDIAKIERLNVLSDEMHELKKVLLRENVLEPSFHNLPFLKNLQNLGKGACTLSGIGRAALLMAATGGVLDSLCLRLYGLDDAFEQELDSNVGLRPWSFPVVDLHLKQVLLKQALPVELLIPEDFLDGLREVTLSASELKELKERLRILYSAGPKTKSEEEEISSLSAAKEDGGDDDHDLSTMGTYIAAPTETFLEELAQKLKIHPISVYWLIEEMRREEGLICPPELKRQTEDYFSVKLLRMLGHRWPMQDQYEKEEGKPFIDPKWVDEDGIIPLTPGAGEETLIERFHRSLDEEFTAEQGPSVEIEAGQILGWKPGDEWGKQKATTLGRWFEREFFKRHVSQFKKRPIAWHLTSKEGTFQVIVYYHKFNKNRLTILRARQVREVLETLRKQLGEARSGEMDRQTLAKIVDLEKKVADIQDFDERLRRLLEGRGREARIWCPWKKPEEQPVGWDPDINDGVKVNIAPVQRLGLLVADVLAAKDLKSLLAPEERN